VTAERRLTWILCQAVGLSHHQGPQASRCTHRVPAARRDYHFGCHQNQQATL